MERKIAYTVIFEPQPEGGYTATVPALPGCVTEGETLQEAKEMAEDAIRCYVESLIKHNEPVPKDVTISGKPAIEKISVHMHMA